jgi:hypothetical protein
MKKELMNFLIFVSIIISIILIYLILYPLKWWDKIFKTKVGNKTIDTLLLLSGKSPI